MDCIEPKTPLRRPKNRRGQKGTCQQVEEFLSYFGSDNVSPFQEAISEELPESRSPLDLITEERICQWLTLQGVHKATPEENKHRYYDKKRHAIGSKVNISGGNSTRASGSSALENFTIASRIDATTPKIAARRKLKEESLPELLCLSQVLVESSPKLHKTFSSSSEEKQGRDRPSLGTCFSMEVENHQLQESN